MSAPPPDPSPVTLSHLLTLELRMELEELFYEPDNFTEMVEEDVNATSTTPAPTTTTKKPTTKPTKPPPAHKWVIPVTFSVGPLIEEEELENITKLWKNATENIQNGTWYDIGNDTKRASKWSENVTYLMWMNDTEMVIPELGKHKWVRYNVGARGLYRVAPQDRHSDESCEAAAGRAAALYSSGAPAERALLLDDAFVLSRARRLPASRAVAAAAHLSTERHWAVWRVVVSHLSWWRELLQVSASAPHLLQLLSTLPPRLPLYTAQDLLDPTISEDQLWLSGALLTAGVEWGSENVTEQALALFDAWINDNETIPEIYQEAAFTAGVRTHGAAAWSSCWRALLDDHAAPRPRHSHRALLAALTAASDDWLTYRFAYTVLSSEAQRGRDWTTWVTVLCEGLCRWRGAAGVWRALGSPLPPAALRAAARCLHQPGDYYRFKELFGDQKGASSALDVIALNTAWVSQADADLLAYFNSVKQNE